MISQCLEGDGKRFLGPFFSLPKLKTEKNYIETKLGFLSFKYLSYVRSL